MKKKNKKGFAPGEARTLNLRISLPLVSGEGTVYKYGALTDCATGAPASFVLKLKLYGDCAAIATYDIHLDSLAVRWPSG